MRKEEYKIIVDYKDVENTDTLGSCSYCQAQGLTPEKAELKVYFLDKAFKVLNPSGEPICRFHFNRIYKNNCYLVTIKGEKTFIAATVGISPTKFRNIVIPEGQFAPCLIGHNVCLRITRDEFTYFCIDCLKSFSKISELIEHLSEDERHRQNFRAVESPAGV